MSAEPKRPPRTSRPRSCIKDEATETCELSDTQVSDGCALLRNSEVNKNDIKHQDPSLQHSGGRESETDKTCGMSTESVIPASGREDCLGTGTACEHLPCQDDISAESQQEPPQSSSAKFVTSAVATCSVMTVPSTAAVAHHSVSTMGISSRPTACSDTKYKSSPKSRKAPPIPPPPFLSKDSTRPSFADCERTVEVLSPRTDDVNETDGKTFVKCSPSVAMASLSPPIGSLDCKPALKPKPIMSTVSRETVGDTSHTEVSSDHVNSDTISTTSTNTITASAPVYAVVNKSRTLRIASNAEKKTANEVGNTVVDKSGTTVARSNNVAVTPPKKPPRTFAHSEYLRLKSLSLPRTSTSSCDYAQVPASSKNIVGIPQATDTMNEDRTEKLTEQTSGSSDKTKGGVMTEPGAKVVEGCVEGKVRRRQSDKLPAPPRPPPPSFPDHRSSTLFTRSSMVLETDSSELLSRSDHYSEEPRTRLESGSEVDDIYAVPSEVGCCAGDGGYDVTRGRSQLTADCLQSTQRSSVSPSRLSNISDGSSSSFTGTVTGDMDSSLQPSTPASRMQAKISNAYSILRLNTAVDDGYSDGALETSHSDGDENDDGVECKSEKWREITEHHQRLLRHVSTTRQLTRSEVMSYASSKTKGHDRLFEYALVAGLETDEDRNQCVVHVLFHCPEQPEETLATVARFCFPDASSWRPVTLYDGERFSFVLPDRTAVRQFAFCRRFLRAGTGNRLPVAVCLVTELRETSLYDQLLRAVEYRLSNIAIESGYELLRSAYNSVCPLPAHELHIRTVGLDGRKMLTLKRLTEDLPNNVSYTKLLEHLSESLLVDVFGSVLLERRVVFCSQHVCMLTSCTHSILSLLYPFDWQHVYVPVLPGVMRHLLESPRPFIIGVLASTYAQLLANDSFQFNEMLVIDLDGGTLLHGYGDERDVIPPKLHKAVIAAIKDDANDSAVMRDAVVSEAFLRLFVETCGHYTDYICTQQDGLRVFERESFIKAVSSASIQRFLEWFTMTQMFEVFMSEQLAGQSHVMFESRVLEYREEMTQLSTSLRQNVRNVGKKIKDFFVESSGKIKKRFQRNVFV